MCKNEVKLSLRKSVIFQGDIKITPVIVKQII